MLVWVVIEMVLVWRCLKNLAKQSAMSYRDAREDNVLITKEMKMNAMNVNDQTV